MIAIIRFARLSSWSKTVWEIGYELPLAEVRAISTCVAASEIDARFETAGDLRARGFEILG